MMMFMMMMFITMFITIFAGEVINARDPEPFLLTFTFFPPFVSWIEPPVTRWGAAFILVRGAVVSNDVRAPFHMLAGDPDFHT